jgi:hypothetical protein
MGLFKLLPCHSGHSNLSSKFAKKLKRSVNKLQFSQKQLNIIDFRVSRRQTDKSHDATDQWKVLFKWSSQQTTIGQQTEELLTGQQTNAEGIKRRRLKQLTHYNLVIMHLYRTYYIKVKQRRILHMTWLTVTEYLCQRWPLIY